MRQDSMTFYFGNPLHSNFRQGGTHRCGSFEIRCREERSILDGPQIIIVPGWKEKGTRSR